MCGCEKAGCDQPSMIAQGVSSRTESCYHRVPGYCQHEIATFGSWLKANSLASEEH